jgi:hypothetical protein
MRTPCHTCFRRARYFAIQRLSGVSGDITYYHCAYEFTAVTYYCEALAGTWVNLDPDAVVYVLAK